MDKQTLIDNRNAVETKFNEVQEQVKQGNEELIRLQGEYRSINNLIETLDELEDKRIVRKKASK